MLDGKVVVIYGAGGPIGSAVACALTREGAKVWLADRSELLCSNRTRAYPALAC